MEIVVALCCVSITELELHFLELPFQDDSRLGWLQEKLVHDSLR